MASRCEVCGKYRSDDLLVMMEGEIGDGTWLECYWCMPPADRLFYYRTAESPRLGAVSRGLRRYGDLLPSYAGSDLPFGSLGSQESPT